MNGKYLVIHSFRDLEDNGYIYKKGTNDIYPRDGLEPSKKRIKELSTNKNKIGKPLIEKIANTENAEEEKTEDANTENTEEEKTEDIETENTEEE